MCIIVYKILGRFLWLLPVLTVLWMLSTFALTFGLAVAQNHTNAVLSLVGENGTDVPERGIFTLCIVIGAILLFFNAELRFLYVKMSFESMSLTPKEKSWVSTLNTVTLGLSSAASLGFILRASFQVDVTPIPHYTGVFLTFVTGAFCCWVHAALTWKMYKEERDRAHFITFIFQIVFSFFILVLLIMFCFGFGHHRLQQNSEKDSDLGSLQSVFLITAVSEWLLAIFIVLYILTFLHGFKHIVFEDAIVKKKAVISVNVNCCTKMLPCLA